MSGRQETFKKMMWNVTAKDLNICYIYNANIKVMYSYWNHKIIVIQLDYNVVNALAIWNIYMD